MATTDAIVTVGDIQFDDNNAKYQDTKDAPFTDYQVKNRYYKSRHTHLLPISSPTAFQGASAAFVQLAAPTLLWVCRWTAAKWASAPNIPNPLTRIKSWVLLSEHYEPTMIVVSPDGVTPLYRISGTYTYGDSDPSPKTVSDIEFPLAPWLESSSFKREMNTGNLDTSIMSALSKAEIVAGS